MWLRSTWRNSSEVSGTSEVCKLQCSIQQVTESALGKPESFLQQYEFRKKTFLFLPGLSHRLVSVHFCTSCIIISFICPLGSLSWNLLFGNCVIFQASDHLLKSCALHANPAYPKCSLEFGTYYSSHFHMVTRRAILHSKRVFGLQSVITSLWERLFLNREKTNKLNSRLLVYKGVVGCTSRLSSIGFFKTFKLTPVFM